MNVIFWKYENIEVVIKFVFACKLFWNHTGIWSELKILSTFAFDYQVAKKNFFVLITMLHSACYIQGRAMSE